MNWCGRCCPFAVVWVPVFFPVVVPPYVPHPYTFSQPLLAASPIPSSPSPPPVAALAPEEEEVEEAEEIRIVRVTEPDDTLMFDNGAWVPACSIRKRNAPSPSPSIDDCCICYEKMMPGVNLCNLRCGHLMHETCIREWCRTQPVAALCPMCREPAVMVSYPSEQAVPRLAAS